MHNDRITWHTTHTQPLKKDYILYWMQQAQRIDNNPALAYAAQRANAFNLPLKVLFILTPNYKDANARHYTFMLEGLKSLIKDFEARGIDFELTIGTFEERLKKAINDAAFVVCDTAYLKPLRAVRSLLAKMAESLHVPLVEIDTDTIVPLKAAPQKCEYAARTIRPKLLKVVDTYLETVDMPALNVKTTQSDDTIKAPIETLLKRINADTSVKKSPYFIGGTEHAYERLEQFIEQCLPRYLDSSDPSKDVTSKLSPYLHFGQISPISLYLRLDEKRDQYGEAVEAFLEQLLVRRELAINFTVHCEGYDRFETMTDAWAYRTMEAHLDDPREYHYTKEDYINARTHDKYFNAAMIEMVETGFMHNYMRMYWGKKIIEWTADYKTAYETILTLNNTYFIDGRDPNSYASVAWLFGRHDRAWTERSIFGKLRYMNENGLKRKFDIDAYAKRMQALKK